MFIDQITREILKQIWRILLTCLHINTEIANVLYVDCRVRIHTQNYHLGLLIPSKELQICAPISPVLNERHNSCSNYWIDVSLTFLYICQESLGEGMVSLAHSSKVHSIMMGRHSGRRGRQLLTFHPHEKVKRGITVLSSLSPFYSDPAPNTANGATHI